MAIERKALEVEHGKKIVDRAEVIWNWASPAGQLRAQRRTVLLIALAEMKPHKKVLEVGCGTGVFTTKFAETGVHLAAIDISPDLLRKAKHRAPNVNFQIADIEKMPFGDGCFDGVVGSSILHHLNIEPALSEIRRVLKSGGRVAFSEPNMLNPQIILEKNTPFLKKWLGDMPHETAFFRWQLLVLLKEYAFEEIHIRPYDFLHPLTPVPLIPLVQKLGMVIEKVPLLREIAGSLIINAKKP